MTNAADPDLDLSARCDCGAITLAARGNDWFRPNQLIFARSHQA